jgi:short-subunit dehydrogenase
VTQDFSHRYGPYALVAGGSDGLGFAFAEGVARRGVNLVLVARDGQRLAASAERLRGRYSVDIRTIARDLADVPGVREAVGALGVEIGLLIYNAAFAPVGPFADHTEDALATAVAVNVHAPLLLTRALTGPMLQRGRGGVILMSSLAGAQGSPRIATYAATKGFNAILAEGLWKELRPHGVDVLACQAGAILTPGYQASSGARPAPGSLPPAAVAEAALGALGHGPLVIPGAINKVARFALARLLPRSAAIALMSAHTGDLS